MSLVSASRPSFHDKPFAAALSGELRRFEQLTLGAWQGVWSLALVGSLVAAATFSARVGLACAGVSAYLLGAYTLLGRRVARRGRRSSLRPWLFAVESTSPWILLLVLVFSAGADYALASWVPPMLFCGLVVAFAARLEPTAALVSGIGSGLVYPVLYLVLIRPRLSAEAAQEITFQMPMQIFRGLSLVAGGALGMLAARGLRAAFDRADTAAREQDLFGKYRLGRRIAAGGMGIVVDAVYQPQGGFLRRVALKRIHEHLAQQPRFVEAFRAEAELCAQLAHPNIVQVVDFGRVGSSYFLAMEYVDGLSLSSFMRRARASDTVMPARVVAFIGRELLGGLEHAHEGARGPDGRPLHVVHRDVCPENVLLSKNGEVKLTDFGVARALRDAAAADTRAVGHIAYMAPEQARGEPIDMRTDLFAVGIVLWELLSGRRLFIRDNDPATLVALMSEPVPAITALRTDIDSGWDALLSRALARTVGERFSSASAMGAALESIPGGDADRARDELAGWIDRLSNMPEPSAPAVAADTVTTVD